MIAPLSQEQLAIWKRQRRDNLHPVVLNVPVTARLFGLVDNNKLGHAIRDVVERHEILRTIFPSDHNEIPHQEILDASFVPELEICHVGKQSIGQIFNKAVDYKFDLTREAPLRAHLFSFNPGEHTLLLVFHPLAFDGGSIEPLMVDLFAFYSARIENRKPTLQAMPMQYADYAIMRRCSPENATVSEKEVRTQESEHGRPNARGIVPMRISPGVHCRLLEYAKEAGVVTGLIIPAAFAALCAHLDLGKRMIFNMVDSQRDRFSSTFPMIGRFKKILQLRIATQGNPTFRDLVGRVAQSYTDACQNQDRSDNYSKTEAGYAAMQFQTLFEMKPVGAETFEFPMLKVFVNPAPMTETGFELVFDLAERRDHQGRAQGIEGSVLFDRNVFAPRHMPARLDWMMNLLKHGLQNPDLCINELPLEDRVTAWVRAALAPECAATVPKRVSVTKVATVYGDGLHERVALADSDGISAIASAPWWQQGYVTYQDALQCRLVGIWEETLNVCRIGIRDKFADLGGDHRKARRVIGIMNRVLHKNFPVSLMPGGTTVEALSRAICKELSFEQVSTIRPEEQNSRLPLFFIHGDVNGGGLYTTELSDHLGANQPLYTFNPHGLDGRSIPESIEKMAEDYLTILQRLQQTGIFWLGGFCNGALIAYEMARMLEQKGQKLRTPVLLLEAPPGDISEPPTAEQELRPENRTAPPLDLQMRKAWVLNELFRLSGRYRPGKYAGPVVMIQPDKSLSNELLVQSVWNKAASNLQVITMPGDHITSIGRHVPQLAGILRGVMETYDSMKRKDE